MGKGYNKEWVRGIIKNPLKGYNEIKESFCENNNGLETPMPELEAIISKMKNDLYSNKVNEYCNENNFAMWQRNIIDMLITNVISEKFPYKSTITTIISVIQFFDILSRDDKGFYDNWDAFQEHIHDPRKEQYAYFFSHKYGNHLNKILGMFPDEIIIPTYEHLWATDLMRVRGIPIRFIGLSNDFLYVDEFWQSPLEFLWHDGDHSLRMAYEDAKYCEENNMTREDYIKQSVSFSNSYLDEIKIKKTDSVEEKEIKKLKKLILFEITHEDSKPFMKDVIISSIQTEEWFDIHRENIVKDEKTWKWKREKTIEAWSWISPLAFLLHKLQHWFFDQVDRQIPQIVSPEYRTAEYIAKAAYGVLKDLDAKPEWWADVDSKGNVSYDWLLKRTCSKSVWKVHNKDHRDSAIATHGDWTQV